MNYSDKLKDPRWQRIRSETLARDGFRCRLCGDATQTLHVHHIIYKGSNPWDTPMEHLITVCESCHEITKHCATEAQFKAFKRMLVRIDFGLLLEDEESRNLIMETLNGPPLEKAV